MTDDANATLYVRLGGYDAIAAIVHDLYVRLFADPEIGTYFKGHNRKSRQSFIQHTVDFVCETTGGPVIYTGLDMRTAHEGLSLSEANWSITGKHLVAALVASGQGERETGELLTLINGYKDDIVERAGGYAT